MSQAERGFLKELRQAGYSGVRRSRISRGCQAIVEQLLTCNAVRWRPSGRGRVLQVIDEGALEAIIEQRYPLGLDDPQPAHDRASAVWGTGDAKRAARGACEGIFMRSTRPGVVLRAAEDGSTIPVTDLTRVAGGAALLLDDERTWQFAGTVAVVENAEAFWRHHRVLDVDLAIYSAGRMSSRRLLAWLASDVMRDCLYVHWGDYDPVGAAEYLRLCEACPGRVHMHLPGNLDALVARYGKRELLVDQLDTLRHVRHFTADAVIAQLVDIWDRRQRGLEQELLLRSGAGLPHAPPIGG